MKINKVTMIHKGLYAHICPLCGNILASSSDEEMMPEFSICECDKNGNKLPVYETYDAVDSIMIRRNTYPRFVGKVTMGMQSDIEDVKWIDKVNNVMDAARAMNKAAEFLRKRKNYDKR